MEIGSVFLLHVTVHFIKNVTKTATSCSKQFNKPCKTAFVVWGLGANRSIKIMRTRKSYCHYSTQSVFLLVQRVKSCIAHSQASVSQSIIICISKLKLYIDSVLWFCQQRALSEKITSRKFSTFNSTSTFLSS